MSTPSSLNATILNSYRYDLRATFDIEVGKSPSPVERFTVHTDVFTKRSRFLCAARKPEWLTDATKPVDLTDEDPEVFQAYLNCVYFGPQTLREHAEEFERQIEQFNTIICVCSHGTVLESSLVPVLENFGPIKSVWPGPLLDVTLQSVYCIEFANSEGGTRAIASLDGNTLDGHQLYAFTTSAGSANAKIATSRLSKAGCTALIELYLLADKLQDFTTANMVMDELVQFIAETAEIPKYALTSLVYNSTANNSPLRALLRDCWVHQMPTDAIDRLKADCFPRDFLEDVAMELMRLKLGIIQSEDYERSKRWDKCLYHQHDEEHPRCGAQ